MRKAAPREICHFCASRSIRIRMAVPKMERVLSTSSALSSSNAITGT